VLENEGNGLERGQNVWITEHFQGSYGEYLEISWITKKVDPGKIVS